MFYKRHTVPSTISWVLMFLYLVPIVLSGNISTESVCPSQRCNCNSLFLFMYLMSPLRTKQGLVVHLKCEYNQDTINFQTYCMVGHVIASLALSSHLLDIQYIYGGVQKVMQPGFFL